VRDHHIATKILYKQIKISINVKKDSPQYKGHDLSINAKDAAQRFESNEDILRNNILKLIKILNSNS